MTPAAAMAADTAMELDDAQKMELLRSIWQRRTFTVPVRILITVSIIDPETGKKLYEKLAKILKIKKPA